MIISDLRSEVARERRMPTQYKWRKPMKRRSLLATLVLAASLIGGAQALAQDDILSKAITDPAKDHWSIQGKEQKTTVAKSDAVPGGAAFRIRVDRAGPNPWDVSAQGSVAGAIRKGDVVLLGFWARSDKAPDPATPSKVNVRLQQNAAPYPAVAEISGLQLSPEWKMYYVSGKSPLDLDAGRGGVAIHLATARQTIELGPYTVLNLGPDYDPKRLPTNP
jgi:hypothetical protein